MPAQQRDSKKNYIGIVNDGVAEQRAIGSLAKIRQFREGLFPCVDGGRAETATRDEKLTLLLAPSRLTSRHY